MIHRFNLVNQVTSRVSAEQLAQTLGPSLQSEVSESARRRIMRSLAVVEARERVCRAANDAGVEIALLKQAALEALGLATPARRYATDVDVLVRLEEVSRLSERLKSSGCTTETSKDHAHGVTVLRTQDDIGIELHSTIVDVVPGGNVADLDALRQCELLTKRDDSENCIWVPTPVVVGAHLIVQGWYLFHFVPNAPRHKSPFRVLADISLIGIHRKPAMANEMLRLIEHEVPTDEFFGLIELVGCLAGGELDSLTDLGRRMLNHALAAELDAGYRYGLLLGRQRDALRREGMVGWSLRQFNRAFRPRRDVLTQLVQNGQCRNVAAARLYVPWVMLLAAGRGVWSGLKRAGK